MSEFTFIGKLSCNAPLTNSGIVTPIIDCINTSGPARVEIKGSYQSGGLGVQFRNVDTHSGGMYVTSDKKVSIVQGADISKNILCVDEKGCVSADRYESTSFQADGGFRLTGDSVKDAQWSISLCGQENLGFYRNGSLKRVARKRDGAWYQQSDQRYKENIVPLNNNESLERLKRVDVYSYRFNETPNAFHKSIGVLAQEVEPIFPDCVSYDEKSDRYTVSYEQLFVHSVAANKELLKQVNENQERINKLRVLVATLQTKVT